LSKEVHVLAGRIHAPGRIDLIEVAEPELKPREDKAGQVIFQPECACLCGSDLPYFEMNGEFHDPEVGQSLHEIVGSVVASSNSRYRPGDRVLAVPENHFGLFERFVVSDERVIPLDRRVPDEHALMAQPLGTVICALKKLPEILDKDVVVVGQGPIGQMFCAALRNLGARQIVAVDLLPSRLAVSPSSGATHVICNKTEDPRAIVAELTQGRMADIVVEAVGHRDQALNLCVQLCRVNGRILYFGVPPETIDGVRWRDLFVKNLTVHTSVFPDFRRDFPLAMRWIGEGRVDFSKLITHRYPLSQIQQAFELFRDRGEGALKVLVEFPARARASHA
jgi:threonine dehydrogenase-like Zn-dependent dehydrogenase